MKTRSQQPRRGTTEIASRFNGWDKNANEVKKNFEVNEVKKNFEVNFERSDNFEIIGNIINKKARNMKKLLIITGLVAVTAFLSCGNETEKLRLANDSIENVNNQQKEILYDLTETLVEVSTSLDSIAAGEGLLKRSGDGKTLTRQQVIDNLNSFKQMLAENREKLNAMQAQLSQRNDQIGKLSALIKHLNNELDEREATIAKLEEVITQQKGTIRDLQSALEVKTLAMSEMEEENVQQREQLAKQDAAQHAVYFTFGTKKQLKERGLLKGGFMKKAKLDNSAIDKALFTQADRRLLAEIALPSKKAEVVSGQPKDAYTIESSKDGKCRLVITNKERFWNISDVLVIQTD